MQIATQLRTALPTLNDPIGRFWATFAILQAFSPDTIASDAEAGLAAARAVGAPSYVAYILRTAAVRLFHADRPSLDRAIAELDDAIQLHESVGTTSNWEWMVLTWGRTLADDLAALDTLREAVMRTYEKRNWTAVAGTLEAAPVLLAQVAPAAAATVYGYLEQSPPPWGRTGVTLRSIATELVNGMPDNEAHRARGAGMDRHDIVALTLAAIAEN